MKKFVWFAIAIIGFGFSLFADKLVESYVHYGRNLGYASYCDYKNEFYYYVYAADYKTCSAERRKDYIDFLLSEEGMRAMFSARLEQDKTVTGFELFEFLYIDFFDSTSDYTVMRAYAISRKDGSDSGYYVRLYDKLGQTIEKIKITEVDFDKLTDIMFANEFIDIKKVWNDLKKKKR